jgi:hypothetical protein
MFETMQDTQQDGVSLNLNHSTQASDKQAPTEDRSHRLTQSAACEVSKLTQEYEIEGGLLHLTHSRQHSFTSVNPVDQLQHLLQLSHAE